MNTYPLPDTDLALLTQTASDNLIHERRTEVDSSIRNIFRRYEILIEEEKRAETALKKVRDRRAQAQGRLDRLKAGDWSALVELEKDLKDKPAPAETP